jgi:hypothetical protein
MPPVATSLGAPPSSTIARGEEEDDASTTREGDDEAVPPSMMIRACTATPVTTIQQHTSRCATIVMRIFGAGGRVAREPRRNVFFFVNPREKTVFLTTSFFYRQVLSASFWRQLFSCTVYSTTHHK